MSNLLIRAARILLLGSLAATAIGGVAFAQASSTQSTTSSGTILQPITLTKGSDIVFGNVIRPTTGTNTVTVNQTTGVRTIGGGGNGAGMTTGATPGRAAYTVAGEGGQTYSITVPGTMNMTRTGGSETLAVTLTPTATTGTLTNALGTAGSGAFGVGGVFTVASTTATGAYTGTFNVTVAYN